MGPHVCSGSFSTEAANSAARPTSASLRKLTSGPDEKLVAMGQKQAFGPIVFSAIAKPDREEFYFHSMTSSASDRNETERLSPIALAVWRFTISS